MTKIVQQKEKEEHERKILGMIGQQKSNMDFGERNGIDRLPLSHNP